MVCWICCACASAKVISTQAIGTVVLTVLNLENDTLARIGTSCFQQLLENNVRKLSTARWDRVVTAFVRLFKTTTPHQLFDESLRSDFDGPPSENTDPAGRFVCFEMEAPFLIAHLFADTQGENIIPAPLPPSGEKITQINHSNDRRLIFKQIIVKCVLQLLLIETTQDLLENDEVYRTIPPDQLLRLMAELDHSYQFARDFNGDKELRTGLWKVGACPRLRDS
jgi:brefeldin A-inhibited guanine nucleotide-exchange protein